MLNLNNIAATLAILGSGALLSACGAGSQAAKANEVPSTSSQGPNASCGGKSGAEGKCGSHKGTEATCGSHKGTEASCGGKSGTETTCGAKKDKASEGGCGSKTPAPVTESETNPDSGVALPDVKVDEVPKGTPAPAKKTRRAPVRHASKNVEAKCGEGTCG